MKEGLGFKTKTSYDVHVKTKQKRKNIPQAYVKLGAKTRLFTSEMTSSVTQDNLLISQVFP